MHTPGQETVRWVKKSEDPGSNSQQPCEKLSMAKAPAMPNAVGRHQDRWGLLAASLASGSERDTV